MEEIKNKLDLHVNDLLLTNVVGMSDHGPILGVIDKVGTMEPEEGSVDFPSVNSQDEHAVTTAGTPPEASQNEDLRKLNQKQVIAELERRRAALDITIQDMKRDVASTGTPQFKAGDETTSAATKVGDSSSSNAKPRKIRRYGDSSPDHH